MGARELSLGAKELPDCWMMSGGGAGAGPGEFPRDSFRKSHILSRVSRPTSFARLRSLKTSLAVSNFESTRVVGFAMLGPS